MTAAPARYVGRFAPSPTGPLHAGSLVAALASWLDARAHGGLWLVRLEDVDRTRCSPGTDHIILQQLAACSLVSDAPVLYQSTRTAHYQRALDQLAANGQAYPCGCSRRDIALALQRSSGGKPRHGELVYPGTCRSKVSGQAAHAWRFRTDVYMQKRPLAQVNTALAAIEYIVTNSLCSSPDIALYGAPESDPCTPVLNGPHVRWYDRRLGWQTQQVAHQVGDFVLKRADQCFSYQLAVVVDDAAQGISHVVRGADLADNTARQLLLQQALGLAMPHYLHTPLVLGANGEKLSKQNGAQALDIKHPLAVLNAAARVLGLPPGAHDVPSALHQWVGQWPDLYNLTL